MLDLPSPPTSRVTSYVLSWPSEAGSDDDVLVPLSACSFSASPPPPLPHAVISPTAAMSAVMVMALRMCVFPVVWM
ncbi:hypothetical protein ACR6C2_22005 [Streptomyces sp. INA 01156]